MFNQAIDHETYEDDVNGVDPNLVWRKGVSITGEHNNSRYAGNDNFERNRTQALRLIIVLLSQTVYNKPEEYLTTLNPFCAYFTCKRTPYIKNFYISLLNTVIDYDTVGFKIPYISWSTAYSPDVKLIDACLGVLNVLNEYKPPTPENVNFLIKGGLVSLEKLRDRFLELPKHKEETEDVTVEMITNDLSQNHFSIMLQTLSGKENLEPLAKGFINIIYNYIESRNTYLPDSILEITFIEDILITFWRYIHENPALLDEII